MSGYAVFLFLMLRGFLGSLSAKPARRSLRESMRLHKLFQDRELKLSGWTTILEKVNMVSSSTREMILDQRIE